MSLQSPVSKNSVLLVGIVCIVAAIGACWIWWPRTAPPGRIPAVAPADPRVELPLDGVALPSLSSADVQKLQEGQVVQLRVGEGSVTIQNMKPAE